MPRSTSKLFDMFIKETENYRCSYFEVLIEKYVKTQHLSDEVDVHTWKVVKDKGSLKKIKTSQRFGHVTQYSCNEGIQALKEWEKKLTKKNHKNKKNDVSEVSEKQDCTTSSDTESESDESSYKENASFTEEISLISSEDEENRFLTKKRYLKSNEKEENKFVNEKRCSRSNNNKENKFLTEKRCLRSNKKEENKYFNEKRCLRSNKNEENKNFNEKRRLESNKNISESLIVTEQLSEEWAPLSSNESESDESAFEKDESFLLRKINQSLLSYERSQYLTEKNCSSSNKKYKCISHKQFSKFSDIKAKRNCKEFLEINKHSKKQRLKEKASLLNESYRPSSEETLELQSLSSRKNCQFLRRPEIKECCVKLVKIDLNSIDHKNTSLKKKSSATVEETLGLVEYKNANLCPVSKKARTHLVSEEDEWISLSDDESNSDYEPSSSEEQTLSSHEDGQFSNFPEIRECCVKLKKVDLNSIEEKNTSLLFEKKSSAEIQEVQEHVESENANLCSVSDKTPTHSGDLCSIACDDFNIKSKELCNIECQNTKGILVVDNKLKPKLKHKIIEKEIVRINAILSPIKPSGGVVASGNSKIKPLPTSASSVSNLWPKFSLVNLGIGTPKANFSKPQSICPFTGTKINSACSSLDPKYKIRTFNFQQKTKKKQCSAIYEAEKILSVNIFSKNQVDKQMENKVDKQMKLDCNFSGIKTLPCPIRFSSVGSKKPTPIIRGENLPLCFR